MTDQPTGRRPRQPKAAVRMCLEWLRGGQGVRRRRTKGCSDHQLTRSVMRMSSTLALSSTPCA